MKSNVLLISTNTPPLREGSCTTPFVWFLQEREEEAWDFDRGRNKVEHVAERMGDLHLPLLLNPQELKHHYEGAC